MSAEGQPTQPQPSDEAARGAAASSGEPVAPEPAAIESVFLSTPSDDALEEQRERLRSLMDRGGLVLVVIGVVLVVAALLNLVRGTGSVAQWIAPVVIFALVWLLYWGSQRMANRPNDAMEVPADLAPPLNDITVTRGEILASG